MAEYIDKEKFEAEEQSGFDFRKLWSLVILNWYWIILSTVLFVAAAFIYLRYQAPVYQAFTKVLIKDERGKKTGGQELALDQLGLISNTNGFDNELEILSSTAVATRAVRALKLYVTYHLQGRVSEAELYKTSPYLVDLEEGRLELLEVAIPIEMTKLENGIHVKVQLPSKGEEPEFLERDLTAFPCLLSTKVGKIMFTQNPGHEMPDRKLTATIYPPIYVGRAYAKNIDVAPTSKTTTVATLALLDTQVERAKDYLLQLVDSYNDDANEDKNEVAKKTEEFINERIDVPMVRVVGEGMEPAIMNTKEALRRAYDQGLDLVMISPQANPPVCKIIEYQKFLYEQKKREKERKANSTKIVIKEIRLSPQTDDHDFEFKLNHAIRFLKEGNKVKVDVFFRGRSIVYKEQGEQQLLKFAEALLEYGKPEQMPRLEGKRMLMIIAPKK